jgi:hypothetical protein
MTLPAAPLIATFPITGIANITSITAGQAGQIALLEFASQGCRVVMGGNLLINGDYLSTAGGFLVLAANGSNWEEVNRTSTIIQPYNAAPNGDFRGWARPFTTGTQFTAPANNTQTADRWYWNFQGTGVVNVLQDTSLPAVGANMPGSLFSGKINVTTADTSLAASDLYAYYTIIEGYDFQPLINGFAASWWAKAHRTGTYCVSFLNRAFNRSYIVEYNISVADTWQYFTAVVPAPTGTWNFDTAIGMYCVFSLAEGTTWGSGTAGSWLTSGSYATANQVNGVAATSDTFSVWGLNVVPGTVPQPFLPMPFALQLERLKRYYQIIVIGGGDVGVGSCATTNTGYVARALATEMGGAPSLILSSVAHFSAFVNGSTVLATLVNNQNSARSMELAFSTAGTPFVAGGACLILANSASSLLALEWNPT